MIRVPFRLLLASLALASCVLFGADAPRVAMVQSGEHGKGLAEFFASKDIVVIDLSDSFERGEAPDLSKTDLLLIGSLVTNDPEKRATYRAMAAAMRQFVEGGGTIAVLAQAADAAPAESWMREPGRIVRSIVESAKLAIRQAKHPLLTTPEKLAASDLNALRLPGKATAPNTSDFVTNWAEGAVILSTDQAGSPKTAVLVEMGWGKGRVIFCALGPDVAAGAESEVGRQAAPKLLQNILAYATSVRAGKPPAMDTTLPPGYRHAICGSVYVDLNADGQRGAGEPGRAGVGVSDGASVALTDVSGEYELRNEERDSRFVFIHQSGDLKQTGDGFFRRLPNDAGPDVRFDFGVTTLAAGTVPSDTVRFVQLTDSHVRSVSDRNYMMQATSEIYAMNPPPDFVVATGDIVDAGLDEQFQNYVAGMQKPPVPYFNVFGNHEVIRGPIERYHRYIGPDYYSFERGGILFLALNCVTTSPRQDAWLAKTLEVLGEGRAVVVFQHYPPELPQMERFAGLGVKSVFSGHWHSEKEIEHSAVQSINSPTFIMGGIDASPAGFKLVRLARDGSAETEWRYGFQKQRVTIVSPQQGSPVAAESFPVVVNAYDTTTNVASVNWRLGDKSSPQGNGSLERQSASSWAGTSRHPSLAPGTYPLHVEVKDEQGAIWTADQQVDAIQGTPAVPEPTGEWPMFMGDAAHTGYSSGTIGTPLRLAWSVDTGGDPDFASPVLAGGRIYLALKKRTRGRSNGVAAFDPVNGKRLWFFQTPNAINHTPAYANGKLCAAEVGGRLYGLDASSGEKLWHHDLINARGRYHYGAPIALEGSFYAGVMRVLANLSSADGSLKWQERLGETDTDWLSSYGSPAASGEYVAISGRSKGDCVLIARREDGKKLWGHPAEGGMLGSVTMAGERVLFCGTKSTLFCQRLSDGTPIWEQRLGAKGGDANWSATTPAVKMTAEGMGIVVAGSGDGRMSGLDLADGRILWTHVSDPTVYKVSPYRRDDRPLLSSPTIAGDKVFFGSADGHVYGLDLQTGKKLWSFVVGVPVMSTPMVSGNALYVAAYDGRLYAFTAAENATR